MSRYQATVSWQNGGPDFVSNKYSREHEWLFEGGAAVKATAAPDIVPEPWSNPANVDPETAFVASLSSCHMLFFLHFAARQGFNVTSYQDQAEGYLEKNEQDKMSMTRVILRPRVICSGDRIPDQADLDALHRAAHEHCFIANSVTTSITIEPAGAQVA
jgi:organic hydroperoxide reductase OsmC/OhrA